MKFFTLEGRAKRMEYFRHGVTHLFVLLLLIGLAGETSRSSSDTLPAAFGMLLVVLVLFVDSVCVTVRRFHDLDRPGSQYWSLMIPFYNFYLHCVLLFKAGTPGLNRYDEDYPTPQLTLPGDVPQDAEYHCSRCGAAFEYGAPSCPGCGDIFEYNV